jgi:glycerophosphoryl diester phosphodiesterase
MMRCWKSLAGVGVLVLSVVATIQGKALLWEGSSVRSWLGEAGAASRQPSTQKALPGGSLSPNLIIIGHRGASGTLPEHTLESYKLAVKQGADYIEPDVVSTRDGVLIARHENEISGTTDVASKFPRRKRTKVIDGRKVTGWFSEDFTWKEIQTLRARERLSFRSQKNNGRYRIPSLEQILRWLTTSNRKRSKPVGVYIETKHPTYFKKRGLELGPRIVRLLKKYKLNHAKAPVFLQSFEVGNLQRLRTQTKVKLVQLVYVGKYKPWDFVVSKDKRTYGDLMTAKGLKFVASYAQGIGPWKGLLLKNPRSLRLQSSGLLERAHKAGLLVHAWTFRNEARYLHPAFQKNPIQEYHFFFRMGLDGLFSDYPGTAVKALKLYNP